MLVPQKEDTRYFQPGTALNRILREAPYFPRCSDNKTATLVRPREYAIRRSYMQVNRPGFASWLIFDLDHANSWLWEDAGLPAPNLIVRNRTTGRSQVYYAITPVCTTAAAGPKPIAYMRAVYEAMALKLNADPRYHSGPVAKTPGHPAWCTTELHAHVYELGELADCVELVRCSPWSKGANYDDAMHSRHCLLFEQLRHYAYAVVGRARECGTLESFMVLLEAYATGANNFQRFGFSTPLPHSSVKATVRSVARWTWDKYTGSRRVNLGVMQLGEHLPLAERQKLAAERTHAARATATKSKILGACRLLKARGKELAHTAIARMTGLTRQTVAKYKEVIQTAHLPPPEPRQDPASSKTTDVKYAAHQVIGGRAVISADDDCSLETVVSPTSLVLDG